MLVSLVCVDKKVEARRDVLRTSYQNIGMYYRQTEIDRAFKYFYASEKVYSSLEKNRSIKTELYTFPYGITLIDLAKLSRKVKDFAESEALTIKAIQNFEKSNNLSYLPLAYNTLGTLAKQSERYSEAINYYNKAAEIAENTPKDTLYKALVQNNIGTVYKSIGEYRKAEKSFIEGLSYKNFLKKNLID